MNFYKKYLMRRRVLKVLCYPFSLVSLWIVFFTIKWFKLLFYGDWVYENVNPYSISHLCQISGDYFVVGGFTIFSSFLIALILDYGFRKLSSCMN